MENLFIILRPYYNPNVKQSPERLINIAIPVKSITLITNVPGCYAKVTYNNALSCIDTVMTNETFEDITSRLFKITGQDYGNEPNKH